MVARQYITQPQLWEKTAREWTAQHAGGLQSGEAEKVARLAAMGFDEKAIRRALAQSSGDEAAALERLLA